MTLTCFTDNSKQWYIDKLFASSLVRQNTFRWCLFLYKSVCIPSLTFFRKVLAFTMIMYSMRRFSCKSMYVIVIVLHSKKHMCNQNNFNIPSNVFKSCIRMRSCYFRFQLNILAGSYNLTVQLSKAERAEFLIPIKAVI